MEIELQLKEALRFMLLPVPAEKEGACALAIGNVLKTNDIDENSYFEFLSQRYDAWVTDGKLDPVLKRVIQAALIAADEFLGELFALKYFDIHSALLSNPFITPRLSIIALSHLRIIVHLADQEKMSAAKIAKVLRAADNRLSSLSWKQITTILRPLGKLPQLDQDQVALLYLEDERIQAEYFADAGLEESIRLIGDVAGGLQFQGDAAVLLSSMTKPGNVHLPYLQILHYQTLISGFYNHVPTTPYEFNPRGQIANWIFSRWDPLLHTSNPILNNAKAVDVLDENWARSRGSNEYEQASALVEILKGLDGMGYAAAQELASWIRRWLVRYIVAESTSIIPLPTNLSSESVEKLLENIKVKPTATFGILEQRYMDALAFTLFPKDDGWRPRGLSDAVNSNNYAKRKLGDCDFQNVTTKEVIAFEAHGGTLNKIYFDGHARTFRRALSRRKDELESVADLDQWKFKVVFVAYEFEKTLPSHFVIDGICITCEFITLNELAERVKTLPERRNANINELFIKTINDRRTPSQVRDKVRAWLLPNS